MQRKVIISCAVTGSADTPGRNPAVPVTPQQIARVGDRRRQGRGRHRAHPCARSPDHPAQHGQGAVSRGGRAHPRERQRRTHQPHHRARRALYARRRRSPQARPRHQSEAAGPARRAHHRAQAGHLQPRYGQHEHGRHVFVNTPSYLEAMAVAIRDAGVVPNSKCSRPGICCSPSA